MKYEDLDECLSLLLRCFTVTSGKFVEPKGKKEQSLIESLDKSLKDVFGECKRSSVTVSCNKPFTYNSVYFFLYAGGKSFFICKKYEEFVSVKESNGSMKGEAYATVL